MSEIEQLVAWQGELELLDARWSLDSGRTVDFRLVEQPGIDSVHPFKQYQRRRNGKVGQSFAGTIVEVGRETPAYHGELMFAGWGDTSDKGQWVRWWLDEEAGLHPFAGFERRSARGPGQLFMAAFVLTVEPGGARDAGDEGNGPAQRPAKGRPFSSQAHLIVTGNFFCQWLTEKSEWTAKLHAQGLAWTPELAKRFVKFKIGVESLSDLDRNPEAVERFHELIRKPYARWRENKGHGAGGYGMDQHSGPESYG